MEFTAGLRIYNGKDLAALSIYSFPVKEFIKKKMLKILFRHFLPHFFRLSQLKLITNLHRCRFDANSVPSVLIYRKMKWKKMAEKCMDVFYVYCHRCQNINALLHAVYTFL